MSAPLSLDQYKISFPESKAIAAPLLSDPQLVHKVSFRPYGDYKTAKKIIFTVHGLTGDTLNYHYLSEWFIKKGYTIINIDIMGRGASGNQCWAKGDDDDSTEITTIDPIEFKKITTTTIDPSNYSYIQYISDLINLIKYIRQTTTVPDVKWFWVGTSMGGLLGMLLTTQYEKLAEIGVKFSGLFFNDIAPLVPWGEIERIAQYVVVDTLMESPEAATQYYESLYKKHFGPKTDTQFFAHRAMYSLVKEDKEERKEEGIDTTTPPPITTTTSGYRVSYDRPGVRRGLTDTSLGNGFIEHPELGKCWTCLPQFQKLTAPLLVYRGELSILLPQVLLDHMDNDYTERGCEFKSIIWPETGHTPPLYKEDEFEPIFQWFEKY